MHKIVIAACVGLLAALPPDEWGVTITDFQSSGQALPEAKAITDIDICGGRGAIAYVHSRGISDNKINVRYDQLDSNLLYKDTVIIRDPFDIHQSGLGYSMSCADDDSNGKTIFASRLVEDSTSLDPTVLLFKGSWASWTMTQVLRAKGTTASHINFGSSVSADKASSRVLAVGCSGCEDETGTSTIGAVYMFESMTNDAWTNSAVLTLPEKSSFQNAHLGMDVKLFDDVLVASGYNTDGGIDTKELFVFGKDENEWTLQQHLRNDNFDGNVPYDFTVFLKDLYIGMPLDHASSLYTGAVESNAGMVYVLKPSPPKPPSVRPEEYYPWTQQQVLKSPVGFDNEYRWYGSMKDAFFGLAVAVDGNTMLVSEPNSVMGFTAPATVDATTSAVWVYSRPNSRDTWSAHQRLYSANGLYTGTNMYGYSLTDPFNIQTNKLALYGKVGMVSTRGTDPDNDLTRYAYLKGNRVWRCLEISVADHFGDGWGGAVLQVTSPRGQKDEFATNCNYIAAVGRDDFNYYDYILPDVLEFKYCPTVPEDVGVYKFRIANISKVQFRHEISWKITNTKDDKIYYGAHDTAMDFGWDKESLSFDFLTAAKLVKNQTECVPCATEAPPHMRSTVFPNDPRWLKIGSTGGESWFHAFEYPRSSTSYYVYDENGTKLITSGQYCPQPFDKPIKCFLDIPDGTYILRMGGKLDTASSNYFMDFCGVSGISTSEQFIFHLNQSTKIVDHCVSLGNPVDFEAVCASYDVKVYGLATITLHGEGFSDFAEKLINSKSDQDALKFAIANGIDGVVPSSVHIVETIGTNVIVVSFAVSASDYDANPREQFGAAFDSFLENLPSIIYSFADRINYAFSSHATALLSNVKSLNIEYKVTDVAADYIRPTTLNLVENVATRTETIDKELEEMNARDSASTSIYQSWSKLQSTTISLQNVVYVLLGSAAVGVALLVSSRTASPIFPNMDKKYARVSTTYSDHDAKI